MANFSPLELVTFLSIFTSLDIDPNDPRSIFTITVVLLLLLPQFENLGCSAAT